MLKISDLRLRDVVNILDGRRLGMIKDVELDLEAGRVKALILPGTGRLMGLFGRNDDMVIPWDKIRTIGVDVILVEVQNFMDVSH